MIVNFISLQNGIKLDQPFINLDDNMIYLITKLKEHNFKHQSLVIKDLLQEHVISYHQGQKAVADPIALVKGVFGNSAHHLSYVSIRQYELDLVSYWLMHYINNNLSRNAASPTYLNKTMLYVMYEQFYEKRLFKLKQNLNKHDFIKQCRETWQFAPQKFVINWSPTKIIVPEKYQVTKMNFDWHNYTKQAGQTPIAEDYPANDWFTIYQN